MGEILLARLRAPWDCGVLIWSLGRVLIGSAECSFGHSAECSLGLRPGGSRTEGSMTEANAMLCYAMLSYAMLLYGMCC